MTIAPPATATRADNWLFSGDALDVCHALSSGRVRDVDRGLRFDLVYLDPPFNVGASFAARTRNGEGRGQRSRGTGPFAYGDAWGGREAFLAMLRPRLAAVRELMAPTASLYLHLDYRTVHYAKVLCDDLFGSGAFRAEIVWAPGNGARSRRGPSITHQTLLVFSKDPRPSGEFVWNVDDPDLREPYAATSMSMHFRGRSPDGRAFRERTIGGKTYRYYADQGRRLGSLWADIPAMTANTPLNRQGTGYPTQKPEKLLQRIVRAASLPGHVVADLMCGSGTTLVAAARLGRTFIGADLSPLAIETTISRLERAQIPFRAGRLEALGIAAGPC
jgi:site-specific DNA-methyltransferase (adenine-specific)